MLRLWSDCAFAQTDIYMFTVRTCKLMLCWITTHLVLVTRITQILLRSMPYGSLDWVVY